MKRRYLLDTNIVSEPIRPLPNSNVLGRIQQHRHEIATASVVWHELLFGCQRLPESRKRHMIAAYLRNVVEQTIPIPLCESCCRMARSGTGAVELRWIVASIC